MWYERVYNYVYYTLIFLSSSFFFKTVQVVPLILSIFIFVMQAIIHPYESKLANYMESVLFMWLVGLLGLGNTTALQAQLQDDVEADHNPKWPNALLYIPVVCGGVVLIVHLLFLIWYNYYDVINSSNKWVQSIIIQCTSIEKMIILIPFTGTCLTNRSSRSI